MEAAVGAVISGSESETGSSEILHAAEEPCKNNYGKNIHLCKARGKTPVWTLELSWRTN